MLDEHSTPFDRHEVRERADGDEEAILPLIRRLLGQCPRALDAVAAAITAGDAEAIRTSAHAVRRLAALLPAVGVMDAAWALESVARRGDPAAIGLVHLRLDTEAARMIDALLLWEFELLDAVRGPARSLRLASIQRPSARP